jgi:hypothetical protein
MTLPAYDRSFVHCNQQENVKVKGTSHNVFKQSSRRKCVRGTGRSVETYDLGCRHSEHVINVYVGLKVRLLTLLTWVIDGVNTS